MCDHTHPQSHHGGQHLPPRHPPPINLATPDVVLGHTEVTITGGGTAAHPHPASRGLQQHGFQVRPYTLFIHQAKLKRSDTVACPKRKIRFSRLFTNHQNLLCAKIFSRPIITPNLVCLKTILLAG